MVPLNAGQDIADLAQKLDIPVIVVVGIRLGCINQARMTFGALQKSGVQCHGWIAACVEQEMLMLNENIQTISQSTDMPLIAVLPYLEKLDPQRLATEIKLKF